MERDFGHLRKNYEANVLDEAQLPNLPNVLGIVFVDRQYTNALFHVIVCIAVCFYIG